WLPLVVAFIHIKRPADFYLQRMTLKPWTPVVSRGEPSGIGLVDRDGEAALDKEVAGGLHRLGGGGEALEIPPHDVGAAFLAGGVGSRRHRMAIEEQTAAK